MSTKKRIYINLIQTAGSGSIKSDKGGKGGRKSSARPSSGRPAAPPSTPPSSPGGKGKK